MFTALPLLFIRFSQSEPLSVSRIPSAITGGPVATYPITLISSPAPLQSHLRYASNCPFPAPGLSVSLSLIYSLFPSVCLCMCIRIPYIFPKVNLKPIYYFSLKPKIFLRGLISAAYLSPSFTQTGDTIIVKLSILSIAISPLHSIFRYYFLVNDFT